MFERTWRSRLAGISALPPWLLTLPALLACTLLLGGCERIGLETPAMSREKADSDGRAIGAACRHAVRAIEDCYVLNPAADRAAVFSGWKDMDVYMRENGLEGVTPVLPKPATPPSAAASSANESASKPAEDEYEYEDEEDSAPPPRRGDRGSAR